MSVYAIQQYHKELEKIIHYGGSKKETAIRNAFYNLLNDYAYSKDLMLIAEISTKNKQGKLITPDGTIKDSIRNDWAYWESKDESDDINEEIRKKFAKGYPSDNILFEDSQTAVLYQHGDEVMRKDMRDEEALHTVLTRFLSYERPEVHDFREAIENFKQDIPKVTVAIRDIIEAQQKTNEALQKAQAGFLEMAKVSINPDINADDVKEMMIQHILSADIFNTIFDEPHFHQENNIARELNRVIDTFFTGNVRRQTLGQIKHYYDTINARAASIADHHEKQKFLKVVYENFYKGYNPKAADRLGIVYTPNEIVQFMIRSTDYLLHKHFGKTLGDKNVEILDPATGTGTFITDIIDYLPKVKLKHKYKNELHANEVAILPYYIANLNIEYTYKQKMGEYEQFDNLCFVDTLDKASQYFIQTGLFGITTENTTRIRRQNEKKISVIIGNPPWNAKQQNYNFQNSNKAYQSIDERVKNTYVKQGTAQNQNQVYDMYLKFYRWASDRLSLNGIVSFVTNRSFIDALAFDGVRKCFQDDFSHIYIIDLGGDLVNKNDKSLPTGNVFGIKTGNAIAILIKDSNNRQERVSLNYHSLSETLNTKEKLEFISEANFSNLDFENIVPDNNNRWLLQVDNDYQQQASLISKDSKAGKTDKSIFKIFSRGIATQRDEWNYDFDKRNLENKIQYFIQVYNDTVENQHSAEKFSIKWDRELENYRKRKIVKTFSNEQVIKSMYRPFTKQYFYFDRHLNGQTYQWFDILKVSKANRYISFISGIAKPFTTLATDNILDLNFLSPAAGGTQTLALYRYDKQGLKLDNISNWALEQFQIRYESIGDSNSHTITKEDIFHYVYAVLHNPAYRKKYELNLKREFPRIPFYDNFHQWVKWGKQLMDLHINYETIEPFPLDRLTNTYELKNAATYELYKKPKLKADKVKGTIVLDGFDELQNIPAEAWEYKLGNRSALEWILDQYKEKKPSDPTIAEKFNTYRFADYKEQVIDLLKRVCTVSVETTKIVREMEEKFINY